MNKTGKKNQRVHVQKLVTTEEVALEYRCDHLRSTLHACEALREVVLSYVQRMQKQAQLVAGRLTEHAFSKEQATDYADVHDHMALVLRHFAKLCQDHDNAYRRVAEASQKAVPIIGVHRVRTIVRECFEGVDPMPPFLAALTPPGKGA